MKSKIILMIISLLILISGLTHGQSDKWQHYFGHNYVRAMAVRGDTLLIGYDYGAEERIISTEKYRLYFDYNSGLTYNYTYAAAIDSAGNEWISVGKTLDYSAKYGLTKFDGKSWTFYTTLPDGHYLYPNLFGTDQHGNIWMVDGSSPNLLKFDGKSWQKYAVSEQAKWGCAANSFLIDKSGNIWIGICDGVIKFDGKNWFHLTPADLNDYNYSVSALASDSKGNLWAGTSKSGLFKYEGNNWIKYDTSNCPLPGNGITALYADKKDNIWIGCSKPYKWQGADTPLGLVKFDGKDWSVFNKRNSGLPSDFITVITGDDYSNIWLGTKDKGFVKFDGGTKWKVYNTSNSSLPVLNIEKIIADKKGNKWFCTQAGLSELEAGAWKIYDIENSGLPANAVTAVAFDSSYSKWIGTGAGLVKYDDKNWIVYNTSNSGLPDNRISTVTVDAKGIKWIGNDLPLDQNPPGGVVRFDGNSWKVYNMKNSPLPTAYITHIKIDSKGNKWIVYNDYDRNPFDVVLEGLFKFNDTTWKNYLDYTNCPIYAAEFDKKGMLWTGSEPFGLSVFDGNKWKDYNMKNSGLPSDIVYAIAIDSSGNIWAGTSDGLAVTDGINWKVFNTSNSELKSNEINSIAVDDSNYLWIAMKDNWVSSFKIDKGILTEAQRSQASAAKEYSLSQNYPNPFNPVTRISYSIPEGVHVKLIIYDILGKEISTLVNEFRAAGKYTVQFNASSLPSGMYIYSFQAGQFRAGKKLLLLR